MQKQDIYERMRALGVTLPPVQEKIGLYRPVQPFGGNLWYCSGCGSVAGAEAFCGKVGVDRTMDEARAAARLCALNLLSNMQAALYDLNRVRRLVKLTGFVNCSAKFAYQPDVLDGASELFLQLFGEEAGLPARSAVGVYALPMGLTCEAELLFEAE